MPTIGVLGYALLTLSATGLLAATKHRHFLAASFASLLACAALLVFALTNDRFELSYVAHYSARDLPLWLKACSLWGGEEGGLLLLAVINASIAWRYRHSHPDTCNTMLMLAAVFSLACLWWSPFAGSTPIPADGAGLNAHLLTVWMAIHPPVVFIAYALIWAPLGPALACLGGAPAKQWREMVEGPTRFGWLLLSTGLASGMWWAFQDFTFGQVWHWDPVQTAVLVVWLLTTAQMHGLRQTPPKAQAPKVLLWASLLSSLSVPLALWIVRDDTLASSHRYVGDTSWPLMAALSAGMILAALYAQLKPSRTERARRVRGHHQLLRFAACLLLACAVVAAAALLYSYGCAEWQCQRTFAPFKASLLTWANNSEAKLIVAAFDQWEVDQYRLLPFLLPLLAAALLLTGHSFMRPSLKRPWITTFAFALLSAGIAFWWQPLQGGFTGTGVTTTHTVSVFQLLEVMLAWCLWPILGAIVWSIRTFRSQRWSALRFSIPVAVIHLGAVLALVGGTVAGSLDRITQRSLQLPSDYNTVHRIGPDLQISLAEPLWLEPHDGGREHENGYRAVSTLSLSFENQRWPASREVAGSTLYRDSRKAHVTQGNNSFRQRCLVLDHRFARHLDRPGLMIDPIIHRALFSDVQVWLPAAPPPVDGETQESLLIVREFPLLSLLWIGWVMVLLGASTLLIAPLFGRHQQPRSLDKQQRIAGEPNNRDAAAPFK